jgi:hypothetical protein
MNYIKNEKGRLVCCSCERDIMEHHKKRCPYA